jgi:Na+-driven multidrug efflux pump
LAIAAQALVGSALGAGDRDGASRVARQVTRYGLVFGLALAALFALLAPVLPPLFTSDPAVLAQVPYAWWFFVALQPVGGVVFVLDGVLLGAGDARFLRTANAFAAFLGFLPVAWTSLSLGLGLVGVWSALTVFVLVRLGNNLTRLRSGRWAVLGAAVPTAA